MHSDIWEIIVMCMCLCIKWETYPFIGIYINGKVIEEIHADHALDYATWICTGDNVHRLCATEFHSLYTFMWCEHYSFVVGAPSTIKAHIILNLKMILMPVWPERSWIFFFFFIELPYDLITETVDSSQSALRCTKYCNWNLDNSIWRINHETYSQNMQPKSIKISY